MSGSNVKDSRARSARGGGGEPALHHISEVAEGLLVRAEAADRRTRNAQERDEAAERHDLSAAARDRAAAERDRESAKIERKMASRGSSLRAALVHAAQIRADAARDRAEAGEDRARAAADRQRAAEERAAILAELNRAHLDELTGAFRRGSGQDALQRELDRAQRDRVRLVLAFVDVDGLRGINNREGHPAGDALLQDVVEAIRSKTRSYEPIVRFGGDEFVCTVAGVDLDQARERFREIRDSLGARKDGASVSVGLAELKRDDSLNDLIERADAALLEARLDRGRSAD